MSFPVSGRKGLPGPSVAPLAAPLLKDQVTLRKRVHDYSLIVSNLQLGVIT